MNTQFSVEQFVDQIMQDGLALEKEEYEKTPTLAQLGFNQDFIDKTTELVKLLMEQEEIYNLSHYFPTIINDTMITLAPNLSNCTREYLNSLNPRRIISLLDVKTKMEKVNIDCTPLIDTYQKMNQILPQIAQRLKPIEVGGSIVKIYPDQVIAKSIDQNFQDSFYCSRII